MACTCKWRPNSNSRSSLTFMHHFDRVSWQIQLTTPSEHPFARLKHVVRFLCSLWLGLATVSHGFWSESWTVLMVSVTFAEKVLPRASYLWCRPTSWPMKKKRRFSESHQLLTRVGCWNCSAFRLLLYLLELTILTVVLFDLKICKNSVDVLICTVTSHLLKRRRGDSIHLAVFLVQRGCSCTRRHYGTILLLVLSSKHD